MKYMRFTCSALAITGTFVAGLVFAEDKSGSRQPDPKMEEMMKKVEAAGTPGASHKALGALVGNWEAEVKCWMDPDALYRIRRRSGQRSLRSFIAPVTPLRRPGPIRHPVKCAWKSRLEMS